MQDESTTRSNNRVTFVPPGPPAPRVEIIHTDLPPAPITAPMPHSSHSDRAHGFVLVTAPLAAATGFVVLLVAISAFGVPVLSVAALLLALAGFTAAWLAAYALHVWVSPDGALFAYVLLTFAYLRREQKERHRRYGK
jgi:uncharacterized membrane protein